MSSDTLEYWYGITPEMLKSMNNNNTKQSEETYIRWSMNMNSAIEVGQIEPEPILTIHPDGRVTTSDRLKSTEAAALVLDQLKTAWLKDAQATKIRELQDRIKWLDEENNELRAEEARLLNTKGELERRIKRFMDAGDAMFPWSERVGQEFWNKAKEDKL